LEKSSAVIKERQKLGAKEIESKQVKVQSTEKELAQSLAKVHRCAHHFGYLSERSTKEKIPEECMICENIVQCMLKKVTG